MKSKNRSIQSLFEPSDRISTLIAVFFTVLVINEIRYSATIANFLGTYGIEHSFFLNIFACLSGLITGFIILFLLATLKRARQQES